MNTIILYLILYVTQTISLMDSKRVLSIFKVDKKSREVMGDDNVMFCLSTAANVKLAFCCPV